MEATGHGHHREQWWAQFLEVSDRFDPAYLVEGLAELVVRRIPNPLLRREVEVATATVTRHLTRPGNTALADQASAAATRLQETLDRMNARSDDGSGSPEAAAVSHALQGRYAAAAAAAEPIAGEAPLRRLFVTALRLEGFDIPMAMRLLELGRSPAEVVRSGSLVGRYRWWPAWLLQVVNERAVAGTLDESTVAALDNCAYASLSQVQAHLARKLLGGDPRLIGDAAQRLDGIGESDVAERLRQGDLNTVALAARLMAM